MQYLISLMHGILRFLSKAEAIRPLGRRYIHDQSASFAVIFALTMVPILMTIGATVDYTRTVSARSRLQSATDALALAFSRSMETGTYSAAGTNQEQKSYFNSNFLMVNYEDYNWWTWSGNAVQNTGRYTVTSRAGIKTSFLQMVNISEVEVKVTSESVFSQGAVEIALVLDNTGSMDGSRMTSLKSAANALVDAIEASNGTTGGSAKIAVVPFNDSVTINTSYWGSWWIDSQDVSSSSRWSGCIWDRYAPYNASNSIPVAGSSNWKTQQYIVDWDCSTSVMTRILPLTNNLTTVRSTINAMKANFNTNIPIGLVWGWDMLTPGLPMSNSVSDSNVRRYLVLVTDGLNSSGVDRANSSTSQLDARTTSLCTSIKGSGITIFSVRVMEGSSSMLSGCATNVSYYYDVTNLSNLTPAFQAIATNMSKLRIVN